MLKIILNTIINTIIGAFPYQYTIQSCWCQKHQGIYTVLNFVYEQLGILSHILAADSYQSYLLVYTKP